jgi:hypothetical protein
VAIPRSLEQGLRALAVLGEEIGDGLKRHFAAEESLDFRAVPSRLFLARPTLKCV